MNRKNRQIGFLFAGLFFVGFLVNYFFQLSRGKSPLYFITSPYQLILIGAIIVFLLSALKDALRWIQPAVFLLLSPVAVISDPQGLYSLGFFLVGCLLFERSGYFLRRKGIKIAVLAAYLLIQEILAVFITKRDLADAVSPTFYIIAFGLFLWFLYKDQLVVYIKEAKPQLSLSAKGLSPAECLYVKALAGGRTIKEIAFDYEITESTVRNTLARAS